MYATESDLVARFGDEIENLKTMLPSQSSVQDAISFLKRVADNKAHLQIQLPVTNQIVDDQPKGRPSTAPVGTSYTGGVFGDSILDQMPSMK